METTHSAPAAEAMEALRGATEIEGGWCIKVLDDGTGCIDVLKMMFNYRVVLSDRGEWIREHTTFRGGWCYYGHGSAADGTPRTMEGAKIAAFLAAAAWDGVGEPTGYDKVAGA